MSTRAKVAILLVMVLLVVGLIVLDQVMNSPSSSSHQETVEMTTPPVNPVATPGMPSTPTDTTGGSAVGTGTDFGTPKITDLNNTGGSTTNPPPGNMDNPSTQKPSGNLSGAGTAGGSAFDTPRGIGGSPFPPSSGFEELGSKVGGSIYTVKEGDSLWTIAQQVYSGKGHWYTKIVDANHDKLPQGEKTILHKGLLLTIPEATITPPKTTKPSNRGGSTPNLGSENAGFGGSDFGGGSTYTVKEGDSLWTIAQKVYSGKGHWYTKVVAANPDKLPQGEKTLLHKGMVLTIPSANTSVPKVEPTRRVDFTSPKVGNTPEGNYTPAGTLDNGFPKSNGSQR